jgi:Family of unknown function (DUF6581)
MTLTTHKEDYDAKYATNLLDGVGQQEIRQASGDLLSRGVISEVGGRRRKTPGRKLRISDLWAHPLTSPPCRFFTKTCR